jgi:hypothetical protein
MRAVVEPEPEPESTPPEPVLMLEGSSCGASASAADEEPAVPTPLALEDAAGGGTRSGGAAGGAVDPVAAAVAVTLMESPEAGVKAVVKALKAAGLEASSKGAREAMAAFKAIKRCAKGHLFGARQPAASAGCPVASRSSGRTCCCVLLWQNRWF